MEDKLKDIVDYCSEDVVEVIENLPAYYEYQDWDRLVKALKKWYRYEDEEQLAQQPRWLQAHCEKEARMALSSDGQPDWNALLDFARKYWRLSKHALQEGTITESDRVEIFTQALYD